MSDYVEFKVQVSKEDIKDYLETFYSDEEIADMDIDDETVEVMNGVLSDRFSDFYVIGKNCIVFTNEG